MATAGNPIYAVPAGVTWNAGRFPQSLSGAVTLADLSPTGAFGVNAAGLSGSILFDDVVASGAFDSVTPPYTLPGAGAAKLIAAAGAHQAVNPGVHSAYNFNYSIFGSYGSGVFNPHWSARGAYMIAGTGGHNHPETFGCVYFDFQSGAWGYIPAVGQADRGSVNDATETNGSPWYEMTGTEIPAPPHPYAQQIVMTPSMGGGDKGSLMYVTRSAVGIGAKGAPVAHKFSLPGGVWSRVASTSVDVGGFPIRDASAGRIYMVPGSMWSYNGLRYLRESDWTWQTSTATGFTPSSGDGSSGSGFLHGRIIVFHQGNGAGGGRFVAIDLDNQGAGWTTLTVTGTAADVSYDNCWVYHEAQGVYYRRYADISGGGTLYPQGQVLYKLTPPASNPLTNTWTISTVTLTGDTVPENANGTSVQTQAYRRLMYVPSIEMLAWVTVNGVALLNPA